MAFNINNIRADFPILKRELRPGVKLAYLDSSATAQKPVSVIAAMEEYYRKFNANIHRGVHQLAEESTAMYEDARKKVAEFIGARSNREVIFTRNTTESINLIAYSWARHNLAKGDLIVLSELEHHSNIVPWQILREELGVQLAYIPVNGDYLLDLEEYQKLLERQPKLVSFAHMSNVLGTISPAAALVHMAKQAGAVTLIDGAQSVPHFPVNVQDLNCDFLAFSAHKMLGPTGIGALWGRIELLESMPPFFGGGDMIRKVSFDGFQPNDLPYKFEAGTPAVAEAVGFAAAIDYLNQVGMVPIEEHEKAITGYALERLGEIPGLITIGPALEHKGGVVSFTMDGVHPHDVAQILDHAGVAVRAGHHCAMPLHAKLGLPATTRASFYVYTSREDIDQLIEGLKQVVRMFA